MPICFDDGGVILNRDSIRQVIHKALLLFAGGYAEQAVAALKSLVDNLERGRRPRMSHLQNENGARRTLVYDPDSRYYTEVLRRVREALRALTAGSIGGAQAALRKALGFGAQPAVPKGE